MQILTFEEWKAKYINIDPKLVDEIKILHPSLDIDAEIEGILKFEYQHYIDGIGIIELPD